MINLKKCLAFAALAMFVVTACKKGNTNPDTSAPTPAPIVTPSNVDVYIVATTSGNKAAYWKNGVETELSNGSSNAAGVFVNGADVYVVGQITGNAVLWKNGSVINLANNSSSSQATAITINGTDVYVAGYVNSAGTQVAAYWKNDVPTLTNVINQFTISQANAIAVSGNNVYMAGNTLVQTTSNSYAISATIWKNGIATQLSNNSAGSTANGVFLNGADVYVVGQIDSMATMWKNGVATMLTTESQSYSDAKSIVVSNNNVYIAGIISGMPACWKNGIGTALTSAPANPLFFDGAIAINGTDIYTAGGMNNSTYSIYWVNGTPVPFANTFVIASGIFVVPH